MFYSDIVNVNRDGIRIQPSAIFPIGIAHGSRCWGTWLENPLSSGNSYSFDHLIVSAIPPDAWPACFRLQVKLRDDTGTLADASRVLTACGINVLSTDCAPAGFSHAVWSATCSSLPIKTWANRERARLFAQTPNPSAEDVHALTLRIALRQFIHMHYTHWALRICGSRFSEPGEEAEPLGRLLQDVDPSEEGIARLAARIERVQHAIDSNEELSSTDLRKGFLDGRFFFGRRLLLNWDAKTIQMAVADEALLEEIQRFGDALPLICDRAGRISRHEFSDASPEARVPLVAEMMRLDFLQQKSRAVDGNMCPTLLGTWCKTPPDAPIFLFQYDAEDRILRFSSSTIETTPFGAHKELDPPTVATASFWSQEGFMRVMPLRKEYRDLRYRVVIAYTVHYERGDSEVARSSQGLLHQVAEILRREGYQLLRVENSLTERPHRLEAGGRNTERGTFKTTVLAPRLIDETMHHQIKDKLEGGVHLSANVVESMEVRLLELSLESVDRIFISCRFTTEFWTPRNKRRLTDLCRAAGFDPISVEDDDRTITDSVVDRLESAAAFLQIIPVDSDENFDQIDMTWMIAEYAMARMAKLPIRRALQQENLTTKRGARWRERLKLDPGYAIAEWWGEALFDQVLPEQLRRLRAAVEERR